MSKMRFLAFVADRKADAVLSKQLFGFQRKAKAGVYDTEIGGNTGKYHSARKRHKIIRLPLRAMRSVSPDAYVPAVHSISKGKTGKADERGLRLFVRRGC